MNRLLSALLLLALSFSAGPARAQEPTPRADGPLVVRAGARDGAVQLTVFCDIEEDACRRLVIVLRRVVETYPEQVGVRFRHRAADGHTQAPAAYRAALAAARQDRGWELLDMACANPDRLDDAGLHSMAVQLRLDAGRFASDIEAADVAQVLEDDGKEAETLKVATVPALFLNSARVPDTSSFDAIDAAIKAAIK